MKTFLAIAVVVVAGLLVAHCSPELNSDGTVDSGRTDADEAAASLRADADEAATSTRTDAETIPTELPIYQLGVGKHDITGPCAELAFQGYFGANTGEGIWMRLWSRAFVFEGASGHRVVFVNIDAAYVFQGVHMAVIERLEEFFGPDVYTAENVLIASSHTHSSPGGFSHYTMFNLPSMGYDPYHFEVVVDGIVKSIISAHDNLAPGAIRFSEGFHMGGAENRSPQAYDRDPATERTAYEDEHGNNTNTRMTVLRLEHVEDLVTRPIGAIVWYAAHATSVSPDNELINGDHQGYAAWLFERDMGADFVAAFAQSDSGDASPNQVFTESDSNVVVRPCDDPARDCDDLGNAEIHGFERYSRARELFDSASEFLDNTVDFRQTFVDMENVEIDPEFADGQTRHTCAAAIGMSTVAGAEDGPGPVFDEGMLFGEDWRLVTILPADQECHAEKPILVPVGRMVPYPWVPTVLPIQIVRLGDVALIAPPFETTSIAGARLRTTIGDRLSYVGVEHVVIAGPANAFSNYVATREEYSAQNYEGASTLFGPWTLAAYQQEFSRLADAMVDGTSVPSSITPVDHSGNQYITVVGVISDAPCFTSLFCSKNFGDVVQGPRESYGAGEEVVVTFVGAHPRNDVRSGTGYLQIQRRVGDRWETVARDWDPETIFRWRRTGGLLSASSEVDITWRIPADTPAAVYRITYHGDARSILGSITGFEGVTEPFEVL